MRMKSILCAALCLSMLLLFAACGQDDELPLLKYSGVELQHSQSGYNYYGSIPSSGADIEIEADSVMAVNIDRQVSYYEDENGQLSPILQGSWGNISYSSESNIAKIDIHIVANTSAKERTFIINLKKGDYNYILTLSQLHN